MDDELPSCDVCYRTDLKLLACGQCHVAKYCGVPHQKLVWYTHKHICDLMKVGEDALFYAPQCEFSDNELRYFGVTMIDGALSLVFPTPVGARFEDPQFEGSKAETLATLNSFTSPIARFRAIAKTRFFMCTGQLQLATKIRYAEKHLETYYPITVLICSLVQLECKLPSEARHFMLPFLNFHAVMESWQSRKNVDMPGRIKLLKNLLEVVQLVLLRLNHLLSTLKKLETEKALVTLFSNYLSNCEQLVKQLKDVAVMMSTR